MDQLKKPTFSSQKLSTVYDLDILDTGIEETFDNIVKIARLVCDANSAYIMFSDGDRLWIKAQLGINLNALSSRLVDGLEFDSTDGFFEDEDLSVDEDNKIIFKHIAGFPINLQLGQVVGYICVVSDVPRKLFPNQRSALYEISLQILGLLELRKKSLHASRDTARIDMIIKNAGVGTWDWDLVSNEVHFDIGWSAMLGYSPGELVNHLDTWDKLCHPEDKTKAYKDITDFLTGKSTSYENVHRLKHKNGDWVYILDRGSIVQWDLNGKPLRFAGTHTDITTQKKDENLKKNIERLKDYFIKNQVSKNDFFNFLVLDVVRLTSSESGFFGEVRTDVEGNVHFKAEFFTDKFLSDEIHIYNDYIKLALNRNEVVVDNIFKSPASSFAVKKIMIIPIWGHGKLIGIIGLVNASNDYSLTNYSELLSYYEVMGDLIQHHLLAEELKNQQNAALHESKLVSLGVLVAGIGHEINNPLTIIHGNLDRLIKKIERNDVTVEYLKKTHDDMFRALVRVENLIKGLRTFSRKDSIVSSPVGFLDLVSETVEMLFQIYKADGIKIDKKFNISGTTKILADRGKIQQILVNLMNNARDVLLDQDDGKITIALYENNEKVIMSISDNGPGIPKEIHDKIFDPFFTTKEVNKGTGLGLSVVADIVRLHGAKVTFESSKNGTTFYLDFMKL